jgi:thiol-disulfide isomerase/thioredoxin
MIRVTLILLILFKLVSISNLQADTSQTKVNTVLVGEISNFKNDYLLLYGTDKLYHVTYHRIAIKNGTFTIPDSLIPVPQMATLRFEDSTTFISLSILLAPDYHLSLTADARDNPTFKKTMTWTGKGSIINRFNSSIWKVPQYYSRDGQFDTWYQNTKSTTDSLFNLSSKIFTDKQDKNYSYFKRLIYYELIFNRLNYLFEHSFNLLDSLSPAEVQLYVNTHFDKKLLETISLEEYLAAPSYRDAMAFSYWYLFYLVKYDSKVEGLPNRKMYEKYLKKITQVYHGKVRDYVLYNFININLVAAINSYEGFNERTNQTTPFLNQIGDKMYTELLWKDINQKKAELSILKKGDPAPIFSLNDSTNHNYDLTQFKGKIVLLDFWASWCGPCRKETPYLQAIYNRYQPTGKIEFISIAVRDKENEWKKALRKDNPSWLQLYDNVGKTAANYFTNAIPKFVIIDEKGLIFDFDAPTPSLEDKLETIIKQKLAEL